MPGPSVESRPLPACGRVRGRYARRVVNTERPRLLQPLLAALASLVLAVGLTWPVALDPVNRLVGHPGNDSWNHVWGYWWVADSVLQGEWPGHTQLLAWPDGGSLYFIDTVQVLMSLPIQMLFGPAVAYNAVMMAGLALAAFAAWLLAARLTGDGVTAGVALVVYGAAPHLLGQAYNGISETVCAGWLPLTLWCVVRLVDRQSWGRAVALGCSAAVCVLTSWYYGLFAILGSIVVMTWQIGLQPYAVDWRRLAVRMGAAAGVTGLLAAPGFLAFRSSLDASDALVSRDPRFVWESLLKHNITDAAAFFRPSKVPSPDLHALYGEELIIVIYVGWVAIGFAVAALLLTRRHRLMAPWVWMGLAFFAFSLGPYLNIGGEYLMPGGRRIPMPFLVLFEAFPVFDRISHPFRFVTGVSLCVALLAAHGLRHLLRRRSTGLRGLVTVIVAVLVVAETHLGSPAVLPIPSGNAHIPSAYRVMAADPVEGAVLDLPMTVPNLERAVYVWYQAAHGRPVPWGLNDPMPEPLLRNRLTTSLIRLEATRAVSLPPEVPQLDLVVAGRTLARQGYRFVVLHEDLVPEFKRLQMIALLNGVFGQGQEYPEDQLRVWVLPDLRDAVAEAGPEDSGTP